VYNPLGTNKSRIVRLPVSVNATFDVERIDSNGRATTTQSIPSIPDNLDRPVSSSAAKYVLAFDTGPLVPVGVNVFKVKQSATISGKSIATQPSFTPESRDLDSRAGAPNDSSTFSVSNGLITVLFDKKTGGMTSITANGATVNVSQSWGYYSSFDAAIDKPVDNSTEAKQVRFVFLSELMGSVRRACSPLIRHIFRIPVHTFFGPASHSRSYTPFHILRGQQL